jgi:hypothetical protein
MRKIELIELTHDCCAVCHKYPDCDWCMEYYTMDCCFKIDNPNSTICAGDNFKRRADK